MREKVLLIQPYIRDFYETRCRTMPLGLAYLAGALIKAGFSVEILDARTKDTKITLAVPAEISYLKEFYKPGNLSPFKLFGHFYHFGMTLEEIETVVKKSGARIFGITCNFTAYFQEALEIARLIKKINPKNLVLLGGAHPTLLPEETLKEAAVDAIVLGEGEIRLPLLIKNLLKKNYRALAKMDGLGWKRRNRNSQTGQSELIFVNPIKKFMEPLDQLPWPAWNLLDLEKYSYNGQKMISLFTSRGCPYQCRFCTVGKIWGQNFRPHSARRVLSGIKLVHDHYGIKTFNFEDDNFTFDKKRAEEILDLIIKNFGRRHLQLFTMNGLETSHLDETLLKKMWQAGFSEINLSVVSLSDRLNQNLRRPFGRKKFLEIYKIARKIGFKINAYIILGLPAAAGSPGQTKKEIISTIKKLASLDVTIGPSFFYPPPQTELLGKNQKLKALQSSKKYSLFRSSVLPLETKEISRLELVTFFRIIRLINFLKSGGPKNKTDKICLDLFRKNKKFYGLRKTGRDRFEVFPEKSDEKLLMQFFALTGFDVNGALADIGDVVGNPL